MFGLFKKDNGIKNWEKRNKEVYGWDYKYNRNVEVTFKNGDSHNFIVDDYSVEYLLDDKHNLTHEDGTIYNGSEMFSVKPLEKIPRGINLYHKYEEYFKKKDVWIVGKSGYGESIQATPENMEKYPENA